MTRLLSALFGLSILAIASAQTFETLPFTPALQLHPDLAKRDGNCPKNYGSCSYIGVPGFCCPSGQNCAIDGVGHAACCPAKAVCMGTIGGSGFVNAGSPATETSEASFAPAAITAGTGSTTTTAAFAGANGAVVSGTGFSTLANPYYPFKVIPTTYLSAGACSAAWTGCQTDYASCTSFLAGKNVGMSVTISAPNFVTAEATALTTYAAPVASSICSSLSLAACSGLSVPACSYFGPGNAAPTNGPVLCGAGVGAMVGIAGQWLLA